MKAVLELRHTLFKRNRERYGLRPLLLINADLCREVAFERKLNGPAGQQHGQAVYHRVMASTA